MRSNKIAKGISAGLVYAATLALACFLSACSVDALPIVEENGLLSKFVESDGAEYYRVRDIKANENASTRAMEPYYVLMFERTASFSIADDGGGVFDCKWDYVYAVGAKLSDEDAFSSGTVAFVVKSVYQRQTYRTSGGDTVSGAQESAEIYLYDIASDTFFAHKELYGEKLADTYVKTMGTSTFVNEVSARDIEAYIESRF